jgi:hypothetical protein
MKIFLSIIGLSFVVFVTSCKKTLEEYNPSGITPEVVFTTPQGFEAVVNAAYGYQRWWYGKEEGYSISEMGTDIWMSGAGDVYPDLTKYVNLQGITGALTTEWRELYAAINLCNAGLNRIGNAGLSPALSTQREAELRFLRSFYYYHIVETWGDVHFTTTETEGIVSVANKTPVDSFYAQMFRDLQFAINNLAPTVNATNYGRVTKPAAMSFLARLFLTRGMNAEANAMAREVINGGYGYELLPNYADLWKMTNQQNKEIVYAVNYSANLSFNDIRDELLNPLGHNRGSNNGHLLFLMRYDDQPGVIRSIEYGRPFNRYMPTRSLLDLFNENIDSRYEGSFQQVWIANSSNRPEGMNIGDTAVYATKQAIGGSPRYKLYDRNAVYNTDGLVKDNLHYVSLSKFMDPSRLSINEAQSAKDVFVIRFAELYMIAAEAQFNLGRSDSAAYYINIVRSRAAKPGQNAAMQITPADVSLDFILDERAREFAGEQLRWFDLKRTGKLFERIKALNPDVAPNIQSFHTIRPIPRTQLDAVTNRAEFTQNPGYQ